MCQRKIRNEAANVKLSYLEAPSGRVSFPEISTTQFPCLLLLYHYILDFKLSPCSEYNMFPFGYFPRVWIIYADVSEHSICSIFKGRCLNYICRRFGTLYLFHLHRHVVPAYIIQTPGNYPEENIKYPKSVTNTEKYYSQNPFNNNTPSKCSHLQSALLSM